MSCKANECEVNHIEMIETETEKALRLDMEHGFVIHLKWVADRGLRLRSVLPCSG